MRARFVLTLLAVAATLLVTACGSDAEPPGAASQQVDGGPFVLRADDIFDVDSVTRAGWKKSKQLSAGLLPGAVEVWYGFFEQKDIEIRFYESHADALVLGVDPADEAIGRVAQSAEAGGKLDQSRARIGYDAYLVVGNMVMLCELEVATCEALVERLD